MAAFPLLYISNGGLIARIEGHLGSDIDHRQGPDRHGGRDKASPLPMTPSMALPLAIDSADPKSSGTTQRTAGPGAPATVNQ
jgi:hypothetical protein